MSLLSKILGKLGKIESKVKTVSKVEVEAKIDIKKKTKTDAESEISTSDREWASRAGLRFDAPLKKKATCLKCNSQDVMITFKTSRKGKHMTWCMTCVERRVTRVVDEKKKLEKETKIEKTRQCQECEGELPAGTPEHISVHDGCAAAFCKGCGMFLSHTIDAVGTLCDDCEQDQEREQEWDRLDVGDFDDYD